MIIISIIILNCDTLFFSMHTPDILNHFESLDINFDSALSEEEFSKYFPVKSEHLTNVFKSLDANNDHFVTRNEISSGMLLLEQSAQPRTMEYPTPYSQNTGFEEDDSNLENLLAGYLNGNL